MLYRELHPEQSYVIEIAEERGIQLKILHHSRPTKSCAEKLDLLKESPEFANLKLNQIVKTLYFTKNDSPLIGVITPEVERNVRPKEVFPKILKMSKGKAEDYKIDTNRVPRGMAWGTCSPFPLVSSMGTEISDLIFFDHPPIRDKLVDISVGGSSREMFQTSMHLPYMAIYEILKEQFGNAVHLYNPST